MKGKIWNKGLLCEVGGGNYESQLFKEWKMKLQDQISKRRNIKNENFHTEKHKRWQESCKMNSYLKIPFKSCSSLSGTSLTITSIQTGMTCIHISRDINSYGTRQNKRSIPALTCSHRDTCTSLQKRNINFFGWDLGTPAIVDIWQR